MAKQYIFVNYRPFDIHVATPSGAGRIVSTGYAVEGTYFLSSWRNGVPLTKLNDEEAKSFDRSRILASISSDAEGLSPEIVEVYNRKEPFRVEKYIGKDVEETKNNIEESLTAAMKELGQKIPTKEDLDKMSTPQLMELATRFNISGSGKRSDLIKMLKVRLEL